MAFSIVIPEGRLVRSKLTNPRVIKLIFLPALTSMVALPPALLERNPSKEEVDLRVCSSVGTGVGVGVGFRVGVGVGFLVGIGVGLGEGSAVGVGSMVGVGVNSSWGCRLSEAEKNRAKDKRDDDD